MAAKPTLGNRLKNIVGFSGTKESNGLIYILWSNRFTPLEEGSHDNNTVILIFYMQDYV